jgi:hypothetical protein
LISPLRIAYSCARLIRTSRATLGRSRPEARHRRCKSAQNAATGLVSPARVREFLHYPERQYL